MAFPFASAEISIGVAEHGPGAHAGTPKTCWPVMPESRAASEVNTTFEPEAEGFELAACPGCPLAVTDSTREPGVQRTVVGSVTHACTPKICCDVVAAGSKFGAAEANAAKRLPLSVSVGVMLSLAPGLPLESAETSTVCCVHGEASSGAVSRQVVRR